MALFPTEPAHGLRPSVKWCSRQPPAITRKRERSSDHQKVPGEQWAAAWSREKTSAPHRAGAQPPGLVQRKEGKGRHACCFALGRERPASGEGGLEPLSLTLTSVSKEHHGDLGLFDVNSRCESGLWPLLGSAHLLWPRASSPQAPGSTFKSL